MPVPRSELSARLRKKSRTHTLASFRPFLIALGIQALLLFGTAYIVVLGPIFREEPEFTARKTIYLPQRELEHRMNVAQLQQVSSPPVMVEKLSTAALVPDAMPAIPKLPDVQFNPMDRNNPLQDANALLGTAGLLGNIQGVTSKNSNVSFFGIEDNARKVVIAFDISRSVLTKAEKSGVPITRIKEETRKLIQQLNANTLFGMVQFSRNFDSFQNYLVPATMKNKAAAAEWLDTEFRTDGRSGSGWTGGSPNGVELVMSAVFSLQPDVVFLLSDASFQRNGTGGSNNENVPWDELARTIADGQEQLENEARLHFIGFEVKESDQSEMSQIVRRYKGRFRQISD